jgi:hypothetical protein
MPIMPSKAIHAERGQNPEVKFLFFRFGTGDWRAEGNIEKKNKYPPIAD